MAVETFYPEQKNMIFPLGYTDKFERNVEAAIYPGRLVIAGTTDYDAKPADCLKPPIGWAGFERANMVNRPATITTAWSTSKEAPIGNAIGKPVYCPSGLAAGFVAEQGDLLIPWGTAGQVAPAIKTRAGYAVKIPFTKKASEFATPVILPAGIFVTGWGLDVRTNVALSTIDVGIKSDEAGGDADGFIDGASCANAGMVAPVETSTTAASLTTGVLIGAQIESGDDTAIFYASPKKYKTDGTAKTVSYTTSEHSIAGYFFLCVESPGIVEVGRAKYGVSAAEAAANIMIESLI